jgi:aminoglycoside 6'-N-acetyltransferase
MNDASLAHHGSSEASPYRFRLIEEGDLALLARWRTAPHVFEWWGAADGPEEPAEDGVAKWIVDFDGRPFAFAQDYDPHAWDGHHFAHLPPGSRGIDQFIGEADMLGRGHGPAFVRQHVGNLFAAGAPAVGTDPHSRNARARRAYEKAGFRVVGGPVATAWGEVILMECWRPESDDAPLQRT